jgi:hypothetical protein
MSQVSLNGEDRVGKWERQKPEFRKQAVERMGERKNLGLLAKELGVCVRTLYRWKESRSHERRSWKVRSNN